MPESETYFNLMPWAKVRAWSDGQGRDLETRDILPDASGWWACVPAGVTGRWQLGLEWEEPRDPAVVHARFQQPVRRVWVEYWRQNWPTEDPNRRRGAQRGWIGRDDPYHGTWTRVRAACRQVDTGYTFDFDPLDLAELPNATQLDVAGDYLPRFRRTLKLRLVVEADEQPVIQQFEVFGKTRVQNMATNIWFTQEASDWSGSLRLYNGTCRLIEPLDFSAGEMVTGTTWTCTTGHTPKGIRVHLRATDAGRESADRTIVTVETATHSFSFAPADLKSGPLYVKDYGVVVTGVDQMSVELNSLYTKPQQQSIVDRVAAEPEQSLERAWAEVPALDVTKQAPYGRYVVLGVDAGRQAWALRYNGELFATKQGLKPAGRDAATLLWAGPEIHFRFGSGDPPDFRERAGATRQSRLDNCLPVFTSRWLDREIEYEQTAFACLLDGAMTLPEQRRGDEPVVALLRFRIRNTTEGSKMAQLWIAPQPQEMLDIHDGTILAHGRIVPDVQVTREWRVQRYESSRIRAHLQTNGRGMLRPLPLPSDTGASQSVDTAILYEVALATGEAHELVLAVPLGTPADDQTLRALSFETQLQQVIGYWRDYLAAGSRVELPDPILADLQRAVRTHVAISTSKDPASGLYVVPAATYFYGACGNEACWQIRMLDLMGHHAQAEAYLETFLRTQGAKALDGLFHSADGALQGYNLDEGEPQVSGFNYNLDHGVIMETLAEHYRLSGDREWLERVAPNLVAACEMIIRERATTMRHEPDGAPVLEYGLLPAGHLEDNKEWRHWFAVNAHAFNGMSRIAAVLAEIDHPAAAQLAAEAAAYRTDIRAAAERAMRNAPVVRLLDGSAVPHVPTRTGIRGREWGWFREAAYGALHLLEGEVWEPHEEQAGWVLRDLEDNLFVSREWGRPVDLERCWFSQGGITIQPNLTDLALDYLRRGQPEHAIRAFYNNIATSLYPDVRVFTEHPVIELGHGVGPFYKSSDESKALIWLRELLIHEEGQVLQLLAGMPRAWFAPGKRVAIHGAATHFGPLSLQTEADDSGITVTLDPPTRSRPAEMHLWLRHPDKKLPHRTLLNNRPYAAVQGEMIALPQSLERLIIRAEYEGRA